MLERQRVKNCVYDAMMLVSLVGEMPSINSPHLEIIVCPKNLIRLQTHFLWPPSAICFLFSYSFFFSLPILR